MIAEVGYRGEVLCDTMENQVLHRYNAHPERICIVHNGVLVNVGGKGPLVFYDIDGVADWLAQHTGDSDGQSILRPSTGTAPEEEGESECAS
jgi:hypothetical protein